MDTESVEIASPCVKLCELVRFGIDQDICAGCFRTLDEIRIWRHISDASKLQVLANVESRKNKLS